MSPQIGTTATQAELFSDLIAGSIAEVKAKFYQLMLQMSILTCLEVMPTRIHSYGRQKPMLLTKVTCNAWQTEQARKTKGGRYIVADPARFHDVHLEIGVKPGLAKLEVLVHHETPTKKYIVEHQLNSVVDGDTAANYRRHRKEFQEIFEKEYHDPGLEFSNRWMLIGRAEYDYRGKTVGEVSTWLTSRINAVGEAVNSTMIELDGRGPFMTGCAPIEPCATQVGNIAAGVIADSTYLNDDVPFQEVEDYQTGVGGPSGTPALLEEDPAVEFIIADNEEVPFPEVTDFETAGFEPAGTPAVIEVDQVPPPIITEVVAKCEANVNTLSETLAIVEENPAPIASEVVTDNVFMQEEVPFVAGGATRETEVEDGTTAHTSADVIADNSPASEEVLFPVLGESGTDASHPAEMVSIVKENEADVVDAIAEVIPASIFTEEEVQSPPES
jgi:hypothetical protein